MVAYNRVMLAGNLTRDPELKFTQNGIPVCNFGLAVNRTFSKTDEVDFFDIAAWRELGETVANYKKKGDPVLLEGRLQYRTWKAEDGSNRQKVDVVADNIQFLSGGQNGNGNGNGARQQASSSEAAPQKKAGDTNLSEKQKQLKAAKEEAARLEAEVSEEDFEDIPF